MNCILEHLLLCNLVLNDPILLVRNPFTWTVTKYTILCFQIFDWEGSECSSSEQRWWTGHWHRWGRWDGGYVAQWNGSQRYENWSHTAICLRPRYSCHARWSRLQIDQEIALVHVTYCRRKKYSFLHKKSSHAQILFGSSLVYFFTRSLFQSLHNLLWSFGLCTNALFLNMVRTCQEGRACKLTHWYTSFFVGAGVDADAARNEEEEVMLRDANTWLSGSSKEEPHAKTGATALHVAAAKGYMKVIKWAQDIVFRPSATVSRIGLKTISCAHLITFI